MKYNQLHEGIIKVPPTILNNVNMYLSSYLYFKIKQYIDRISILSGSNTSDEEKEKIKQDGITVMGKLQQKYGAKNISSSSANGIINKNINLPFDTEQFFSELNFKGVSQGLRQLLKDRIKFELHISSGADNGVSGSLENHDKNTIVISVSTNRLNPRNWLESVNGIMSTAYHEMQHAVQSVALKNINPKDKQLEFKPEYNSSDKDYYTSGVEYTPQLGNLIDGVVSELEKAKLNDKLNPNMNEAIKSALHSIVQKDGTLNEFLKQLYLNDKPQYKKAMKTVYSKVAPTYEDFKTNGIDYAHTELAPEELESKVNVLASIYKIFKNKEDKFNLKAYGKNLASMVSVSIQNKENHWELAFAKSNDSYQTTLIFGQVDEELSLNAQQTLNLAGLAAECGWWEADDVIDEMELLNTDLKDASGGNINEAIDLILGDAEYYELETKRLRYNSFSLFGKVFTIDNSSKTKVDVKTDDDSVYYYVSLKQFINLFQLFIRYYTNEPDEVLEIMNTTRAYMEAINKLRNL